MKITFHGAAGEVTGSQHLLESDGRKILFDCGLFQGRRAESRRKNEEFAYDPREIDVVILSHAHIDHSGNLPRLFRMGFRGRVFCTHATADFVEIMLKDAAKIQQEDSRYLSRHLKPGHPSVEPLYDQDDVDGLMALFEPLDFEKRHEIASGFRIRFLNSGHILGSAITEVDIEKDGVWKRIVFTGDLGRRDLPLLPDPSTIERCDVLICESTYGNRVHPPSRDIKMELLRILKEAIAVGGRVIVPAFALGRTQQLVYFLNELFNENLLPPIPVFVDSPLATRLTKVYRDHLEIMDEEIQLLLRDDDDPFGFPWLRYVRSSHESKELNDREGTMLIISASGMCESGRVVHHLAHAISNPHNTVALIGFQAEHTTGRRIAERQKYVKFFDRDFPLKAHVEKLDGLSAHADVTDFRWWFEQAAQAGGIGQAFLVHGEPDSALALAEVLRDFTDEDPIIPIRGQSFEV
ncbi:MBL fold metallo-hydrolase [uncultured Rubinisphaera sp.]|uniref:MBL fold metallo-hydrolase n=1 Tax=uncultured Rubinisphaera sp. TaxID=1678686 RepID=UPI0030D9FB5F